MSDAGTEPVRFEGDYTVGANYPRAAARATFAFGLTRPARIAPLILILVLTVPLGILIAGSFWWTITVGGLIGGVIGFAISRRRMRRRFEVISPAGSHFHIALGDHIASLRAPHGASQVSYNTWEALETRGDFVILKHRASRIYSVLPAQLFTPESLSWLRTKIIDPLRTPDQTS